MKNCHFSEDELKGHRFYINILLSALIYNSYSCDASKWRLGTTAIVSGLPLALPPQYQVYRPWRVVPQYRRATPSVYCVLLGRPYVTRGLGVVDRTVGACPITCSPTHLTSHLFHSYISTTHSLRPQACVSSFPCDFSVSQATSLGF